jgi:hydroxyacylglutathione hydrolase
METVLIPCLADNYSYLLHDPASNSACVVDPAEADKVAATLEARGWTLTHILNTHHHFDHVGGNEGLKARYGATVFAPQDESAPIPGMDVGVTPGGKIPFGGHMFEIIATPGHTAGHVAFHCPGTDQVFVGDTLFSMGCGRLFEGTAVQMWASMQRLMALPDSTKIYCGHEYTQSNAHFALSLEPGNQDLQTRAAEVDTLRAQGQPTLPSTLDLEKRTNPFLRPHSAEIRQTLNMKGADDTAVFAEIRRRKDNA